MLGVLVLIGIVVVVVWLLKPRGTISESDDDDDLSALL